MTVKPGGHIYFMGIGGTGMASVAGLCQEGGYKVSGSDLEIYPPMSTMLEELNIKVYTPYDAQNLKTAMPDLVCVGNSLSKGHVEVEAMLSQNTPYTSFPKLLGDLFLNKKVSVVVSGTHGKTTTTSLMAHVLEELGENPGFLVGGIPRNFPRSFRLGGSKLFVIEGDEYDTAFFDKESKFLHYHPKHLILNNLEFDHADIFQSLEMIETMFFKLIDLVPNRANIIANVDDPGIAKILSEKSIGKQVLRVSTLGKAKEFDVAVRSLTTKQEASGGALWIGEIQTQALGMIRVETTLTGPHNMANIAQVIGCLISLQKSGELRNPLKPSLIEAAIKSFQGVKRRFDLIGSKRGIDIYEDFAHHPTAVGLVIEAFRKSNPTKRLVVAFEPRNASSRRNVFQKAFAEKLSLADEVMIGKCPVDKRIPEDQRMNTDAMAQDIGKKAKAFAENEQLMDYLAGHLKTGDAVIFMSSGSFSGIQFKLLEKI